MSQLFDFAGVTGAIVFSVGLGLYLEWLGLRGLMRLMPARPVVVSNAQKNTAGEQRPGVKAA